MNKFTVGVVKNSGRVNIGYSVNSKSLGGANRVHMDVRGGDWAKALCERYAAALEHEAAMAGSAGHPAAARAAATVRKEIEATVAERATANKANKAAKPQYRAP